MWIDGGVEVLSKVARSFTLCRVLYRSEGITSVFSESHSWPFILIHLQKQTTTGRENTQEIKIYKRQRGFDFALASGRMEMTDGASCRGTPTAARAGLIFQHRAICCTSVQYFPY